MKDTSNPDEITSSVDLGQAAKDLNSFVKDNLEGLQRGDPETWEKGFLILYVYCFNIMLRTVRPWDKQLIEDLSSELLLRIREKIGQYVPDRSNGTFTKWMSRIVFNIRMDYYREVKRKPTIDLDKLEKFSHDDRVELANNELSDYLKNLLIKLKPIDLQMWLDKHLKGKTLREIAQDPSYQQDNVGAVSARLHAIKKALNKYAMLEKSYESGYEEGL